MSAPSRPLRRDAQRNREALLVAAKEVFAARGLDAPLEDIARAAGVSIGTLYNRFPTRSELVDAALIETVEASVASAEQALAHPDAWQGLVEHLTAIGELQARHRGFTDICVRTLPPGSATELVPALSRVEGTPYRCRAARFEVAENPATYAARAAATAASSWVRREPISMHGRVPAAPVIRDAALATALSWLRIDSTSVSSSTASTNVPLTVRIGEPGKYSSPSG